MAAQAADKQNDELMTDLAGLFKMFSDPTRVKILNILLEGEKCVGDVAAQMNMSTAAVSHHLRMLRQGNLVTDHRQGKEVFYALADDQTCDVPSAVSVRGSSGASGKRRGACGSCGKRSACYEKSTT